MSQLSEKLGKAADKNRELLLILRESEYAPPALKQNTDYVSDLKSQLSATELELNDRRWKRIEEEKEHVKIRDSVMRRFGAKMGGHKAQEKFDAKEEKEEREYLDALRLEIEAKERQNELNKALETAEKERDTLKEDSWKHDQAQAELDQLYRDIFQGPTPEVPGEDQKEEAVRQAWDRFQESQTQLGREQQAADTLEKARKALLRALQDMGDAHSSSNMDRFGGGVMFDLMERNSMSKSQRNLTECNRAIESARALQPQIPQLGGVSIDNGHVMSDMVFDSFFADQAQHERIQGSEGQMQAAMQHLLGIIKEQDERVKGTREGSHAQASKALEDARAELQQIRAQAFEDVPRS